MTIFVYQHGETVAHIAAGAGRLDVLRFLKERGANFDVSDSVSVSPSSLAVSEPGVFGRLSSRRCSRRISPRESIYAEVRKSSDHCALSSLQHGDSTMYWAARQGHTDAIQYLWEQKAKVNTHNKVSLCSTLFNKLRKHVAETVLKSTATL